VHIEDLPAVGVLSVLYISAVGDSTVVYVTCYFCYMFILGRSSGSRVSVRIYRRVIFELAMRANDMYLIYLGV
jgi:hypothetical protein